MGLDLTDAETGDFSGAGTGNVKRQYDTQRGLGTLPWVATESADHADVSIHCTLICMS